MSTQPLDFAVTLTGPVVDLDAFEDALDVLPKACMVGGVEYGPTAELIFTVDAHSPARALAAGLDLLARRRVPVRDQAVLAVRRHEGPGRATDGGTDVEPVRRRSAKTT